MTTKKLLFILSFFCLPLWSIADNYWTLSSDKNIEVPGQRKIFPQEYKLAHLNTNEFNLFQNLIPLESTGLSAYITLPTPDGTSMDFRVFECPMMEQPLADKYPMIKTYTAISLTNPFITAKLDFTVFGFHAMVFNNEETYFIDPYTNMNTDWYVVYYKKDYSKPLNHRMHCEMDDVNPNFLSGDPIHLDNTLPKNVYKQNGTDKRTYRLALACTIEYAQAVTTGTPTKAAVLSAMTTSVNRINGVFEREFSMHANLIANNDTLIFVSGTDPYTNNSGSTMLSQNQTTVNTRIGSANYDFGHVFSTGGGGIASLASVCGSNKAQGVTGSSNPVGDPFDIDYVAHEMGHQFGGNHTFNSVLGSCQGNRSSSSAFEIGSATTIMGYAGICDLDNIQPHSDDYYHTRSLEEMTNSSVTACAQTVPSGNSLPTLASIKQTYIIPYRTAFELVAPQGVDADNDPLKYCWEEYDKGGSSGNAWNAPATSTTFAMQRSFYPTLSRTRTFPALKQLLLNTESYLGERLPENARLFRYRCTLRDIHNGWGGFYTSDSVTVDSRTTTGLFRVTSQAAAGTTWNAWQTETITWDVAGTTGAPFNTANVDIMLSVDSGKTWWTVAPSTPNDGSQTIIVPSINTTLARVKVKAAGNIYFDLNDKFIKINAAPSSVGSESIHPFHVYPNPVMDELTIESYNKSLIEKVRITDIGGRVCLQQSIGKEIGKLNTSTLAKGVYVLEISMAGQTFTHKIIK